MIYLFLKNLGYLRKRVAWWPSDRAPCRSWEGGGEPCREVHPSECFKSYSFKPRAHHTHTLLICLILSIITPDKNTLQKSDT